MTRYTLFLALAFAFTRCNTKSPIENETITKENVDDHTANQGLYTRGDATQIVFCLDATGSMSGLIQTAKNKIWSIITTLAQDTTMDKLELGIVFYRDQGDNFVTQNIPLTRDIDAVYEKLYEMTADGGGDTPESVNQALNEAITLNDWSTDSSTYKAIFIVGDCPPHMDYRDDVKYTESCPVAREKGININTVKLGSACADAIPHFKKIAHYSGGEFLHLDQHASDITVYSPYDDEIKKLSMEIEESKIYYGTEQEQESNYDRKEKALKSYDYSSSTVSSDRTKYNTSQAGKYNWMGGQELITEIVNGSIRLDSIPENHLPKELKGKLKGEQVILINEMTKKRNKGLVRLKELNSLRDDYITSEMKGLEEENSFSEEIKKVMNKQKK